MNYRLGDLDEAIKNTEHGLARNPKDYKWLIALAALYYEQGDKAAALDYLDRALRLDPENGEIKSLMVEYKK